MPGMAETVPEGTVITSVQRAILILETVGSSPQGVTAKDVAEGTGLPPATVWHHLRTLTHEGYTTRTPDGRWILGRRLDLLANGRDQQRTHREERA